MTETFREGSMLSNGSQDLGGQVIDLMVRVSKRNGRGGESYMSETDQETAATRAILARGGKPGKLLTIPEKDQSGFSATDSAAWLEAVERAQTGESAGVAFGYIDRSGRNWWGLGGWYQAMEKASAHILYADAPLLDYRTAEGRQTLGMQAVMNEQIIWVGRHKQEATLSKMLEHRIPNVVPFGYRRNLMDGVKADPTRHAKWIVPDPATRPTVELIFGMRAGGKAWPVIADELEARGLRTPKGSPRWATATMAGIVANKAYIGTMVFGSHVLPGSWEPLVTLSRFNDAQSTRARKRTGRMVAGIAGGLLECSGCGRPMNVHHRPGDKLKDGTRSEPKLSYGCRADSSQGRCPRPVYLDKKLADDFVEAWCAEALGQATFDEVAATAELAQLRTEAELAEADLVEWAAVGSLGLPAAVQRAGLEARQARSSSAAAAVDACLDRLGDAEGLPTSAEGWYDLTPEGKHTVSRRLINRIVVHPFRGTSKKLSRIEDRVTVDPR